MGNEDESGNRPGGIGGRGAPGRRELVGHLLWILGLILVLDIYALWFVGNERTLYHADQVAYWSFSSRLAKVAADRPIAAVQAVASSVALNDVNLLPAVPIAAVMMVAGDSRLVYVLCVLTIYGLAVALALAFALRRIGGIGQPWVAPAALLLLSTIWRPVFIGYLGVGGVALALIVLALVLPRPPDRVGWRQMALAGAVLALLTLFRRWWGVWAAGFVGALVIDAVWQFLGALRRDRKTALEKLAAPVVLGLAAGLTLLVVAAPITIQRLSTDYADRFAAYAVIGMGKGAMAVIGHWGLLGLALVVGAAVVTLRCSETRHAAVFLCLQLVLTYAVMTNIQGHTPQHWYLYYPQALILVGLGVERVVGTLGGSCRRVVLVALAGTGALIAAAVYLPPAARIADACGPLLPADRLQPQQREDLQEVERLLTFLDHMVSRGPARIYVLASSETLSDQVLAFADFSLGGDHSATRAILSAAHVDRRDGFPRGLLEAEVVLVGEPLQVHLRAEEQRVVTEPAESFLEGTDIAGAFRRLPEEFVLQGGVRVHIFVRQRPNTMQEIEALSERLRAAYPDRPEIYAP